MKRQQLAMEILSAGIVLLALMTPAWGQSCQCQNSVSNGSGTMPQAETVFPLYPDQAFPETARTSTSAQKMQSGLPTGWPNQWSGPAIAKQSTANSAGVTGRLVRDPFTGRMVPTTAQARWDRAAETHGKSKTQIAQTEKTAVEKSTSRNAASGQSSVETSSSKTSGSGKSWSVLPSRNGGGSSATIGSGSGSGMSGGGGAGSGMSGGGGGTGSVAGNGSSWTAKSGGASGGGPGGGNSSRTSTGALSNVETKDNTDDIPGDGPNDNDLTDVPLPDPTIPDSTPDVPSENDPNQGGNGYVPGNGGGDSPVVPEPGSIILLGIAGGVGGAGWIRRRIQKSKPAPAV